MWRAKPGAWYLVLRTEGGRDWVYLARFLEPNGHAGGVFSEAYSVFGLHNRVKFCSGEERNPDVYAKLPGELILDHGQLWEAKAP